jgi:hypothetical protein
MANGVEEVGYLEDGEMIQTKSRVYQTAVLGLVSPPTGAHLISVVGDIGVRHKCDDLHGVSLTIFIGLDP